MLSSLHKLLNNITHLLLHLSRATKVKKMDGSDIKSRFLGRKTSSGRTTRLFSDEMERKLLANKLTFEGDVLCRVRSIPNDDGRV